MWGREIGLIQAAEELATVLDLIAQSAGLAHRSDFFPSEEDDEDTPSVQDDAITDELLQQFHESVARFDEAKTRAPLAFEAAKMYVRDDLHLNWPWLVYELYTLLMRETYTYVMGLEVTVGYRFDPDDPPVSPFSWTFETRPGETLNVAQRRFTEEANAAFAQLQSLPDKGPATDLGRIRRDMEEIVRRNTRWFYRHKICHVPWNQLARTYHDERSMKPDHPDFPGCSCRTNVYDGIKAAEKVLGLTPFRF